MTSGSTYDAIPRPGAGRAASFSAGWAVAALASLGLFAALSATQRTGDQGEVVTRSIPFRLPEAPVEEEAPPPAPTPIAREEPPPRPARTDTARRAKPGPAKAVRSAVRAARALTAGIPRKFVHAAGEEAPAVADFGAAPDAAAGLAQQEAQSQANLLLQRDIAERARAAERSRGGPSRRRAGVRPPQALQTPFPENEYPREMLDAGIECVAQIRVTVSAEGAVASVEVEALKPLPGRAGAADLDRWIEVVHRALASVAKGWRFQAAVDRATDLPIEDDLAMNIEFEIAR